MPGVFISYRREDCPGHAGRLFDRLRSRFGTDSVFIDVAGIEAGVDFFEALEKAVGSCDVLLAIIGREWVSTTDAKGRRRLEDPHDFIRLEISTALKRNVRVIPVLVEDAPIPPVDALPDDLKPLIRRQAVALRDTRWDADVEDLIALLAKVLHAAPVPGRARLERQNSAVQAPTAPVPEIDRMDHARSPALSPAPRPARHPRAMWAFGAALLLVLGAVVAGVVAPTYMPEWLGRFSPGDRAARSAAEAPPPPTAPDTIAKTPVEPPVERASHDVTASAAGSKVPNVVGQTLDRGSAALRGAGLVVGSTSSRTARGVAAFQIVSQTPPAGTIAAPGTRVNLVYAKPLMRTLPNVEGDQIDDAIAALKASGFEPQPRALRTNESHPQQVLNQTPKGGTEVEAGTVVELVFAIPATAEPLPAGASRP